MRALSLVSVALVMACAATERPAKPQHASAIGHEEAARRDDEASAAHLREADASAARNLAQCRFAKPSAATCWDAREQSQEHVEMAERHRRAAAEHRATSHGLRAAEARACAGVAPDDRDMSPFARREEIVSAAQLRRGETPVGAVVFFKALPGMSPAALQQIVECHLARNAALGFAVPEMDYCPLVLRGVRAEVVSAPDGFAVRIRSDDPSVAKEIWRRAEALTR